MERLVYQKVNNSDNIIDIDLHNEYIVRAMSGWDPHKKCYITTLFLKRNDVDTLDLIDDAESMEFHATYRNINSVILKVVSDFLRDGFFNHYIDRYEYERSCFEIGNEIKEKERLKNVS